MENLFSSKNENDIVGSIYKDKELSFETQQELDKLSEQINETQGKILKGSALYLISAYALILIPITLVCRMLISLKDGMTFMEELSSSKWFYIICLTIAIIAGTFFIYKRIKMHKITNSEEATEMNANSEVIDKKCREELNIPDDAIDVDYLWEVNEPKAKKLFDFYNQEMFTYIQDESLCIATLSEVYKIPLTEIKEVIKTDTKYKFFNWNKENEPKNNKYNDCKVIVEDAIYYKVKACQINIENSLGNYFIVIPEYEYQVIKELLNK